MNDHPHAAQLEPTGLCAMAARVAFYPLDGLDEDEPALGAHLITQRRGYCHHGIYVGEGRVVHYAGFAGSRYRGPVEEVSLARFAAGHGIAVIPHPCARYIGVQAVARARSRIGEDDYRLLTNNCEHFCTWCLSGESRSQQVEACFAHPRVALITVVSLAKTLLAAERWGLSSGARAA